MLLPLQGCNALVTGASKGLGKALSHKLASMGCSVTLLSRNETMLKSVKENLPVQNDGQRHSYVACNLRDLLRIQSEHCVPSLIDNLHNSLGNKSIIINCAGVTNHSLLARLKVNEIIETIELNLTAPIILSKLAIKPLIKANKGSPFVPVILNISSVLSLTGTYLPGTTAYAALKAGILGFTNSLAEEVRGKVRVNALLPGLIRDTEMGASVPLTGDIKPVNLEKVVRKAIEIICDQSTTAECVSEIK